jgi:hypothetical protein
VWGIAGSKEEITNSDKEEKIVGERFYFEDFDSISMSSTWKDERIKANNPVKTESFNARMF